MIFIFVFSQYSADATGAEYLKIGAGVRPVALGEAFTAIADDAYAPFYNPAGISKIKFFHISAMTMNLYWFGSYNVITTVFPISKKTGLGLSFSYIDIEDKVRDEKGEEGGKFSNYIALPMVSISQDFTKNLSLGTNIRYTATKFYIYRENSFTIDVGYMLKVKKYIYLASTIQFIGSPIIYRRLWEDPPLLIRNGFSVNIPFYDNHALFDMDFILPRNGIPYMGIGGEIQLNLPQEAVEKLNTDWAVIKLYAGYRSNLSFVEWNGLSFGASYEYRYAENFYISFDVLSIPYGPFGTEERISVSLRYYPLSPLKKKKVH